MFITFTTVIFVLSALRFVSLMLAKEKPHKTHEKTSIIKDFQVLIKNKPFLLLVVIYTTYTMANGITTSFIGTYQVRELGLSMMQIYVLSTATSISAIIFLPFTGNYARKNGLLKAILVGSPICALTYLFIAFAVPSNGFIMILLYNIIATFGSAFITVGMEPIIFDVVDEEYQASAISIRGIVACIVSFFTTLAQTPLFNHIQGSGNIFLGIHIYAQQLFGVMSCILLFVSFAFLIVFAKLVKKPAE